MHQQLRLEILLPVSDLVDLLYDQLSWVIVNKPLIAC